jgi:hypothetical protein
MQYSLSTFVAPWSILSGVFPIHAGDICQGDFLCYLLFGIVYYLPYFLALTAVIFVALAIFRRTVSLGNKLIYSILSSFILIFLYHNFLSTAIEKQGLINSYKQDLNQLNYELYEPTYIPSGHELFESRVDNGHLSFYYAGNDARQFVISEFEKPPKIDLSPPDCFIGGDHFEVIDPDASGWSSEVSGKCQGIKTPKGISVYLMTFRIESEKKLAAMILGNTLITISGYHFSDQELMNLIDGLEEKSASDINFKVLDRTIGR